MDNLAETPRFNTNTEAKYFEQPGTQIFFSKWCEINDSITPQFVDRDQWSKKDFFKSNTRGGKTLFLPKDLQLWEIVDVVEEVDKDTYTSNPEFATAKREELRNLGNMFRNTGIYIAQRIDGINLGKSIAEGLAQDFYTYGHALSYGEKPKPTDLKEVAEIKLTPEEIDQVDKWLAGDKLFTSRRAKAEKRISEDPERRDEIMEEERQRTLSQFFEVTERASRRQVDGTAKLDHLWVGKHDQGSSGFRQVEPWEKVTPIKEAFLNRIEDQLKKTIETPKQELVGAIFRRGLQNLVREMRANILPENTRNLLEQLASITGGDFIAQLDRLYEVLDIPTLKAELEQIKSTDDVSKIGEKEVGIALRIQGFIRALPPESAGNNPAEMIAKGYINCVGASALGGGFFSELGINYLVGTVPDHSILLLATSDRRIIWLDMLNSVPNEVITDEMIRKTIRDGKVLKVEDVWNFSHQPTAGGLILDMDSEKFRSQLPHIEEYQSSYLTLLPPKTGHLVQLLNNTATLLYIADMKEEALEADRLAIAVDPQIAELYRNFALTLTSQGHYDEAIEAARKAIALDPRHMESYKELGKALVASNRVQEAVEVYGKALEINPRDCDAQDNLGGAFIKLQRFNEAMNLYHDLISIDPKNVLAHLRLATIYWTFGQNNDAVEYCKKAIKVADKDNEKDRAWADMAQKVIFSITGS